MNEIQAVVDRQAREAGAGSAQKEVDSMDEFRMSGGLSGNPEPPPPAPAAEPLTAEQVVASIRSAWIRHSSHEPEAVALVERYAREQAAIAERNALDHIDGARNAEIAKLRKELDEARSDLEEAKHDLLIVREGCPGCDCRGDNDSSCIPCLLAVAERRTNEIAKLRAQLAHVCRLRPKDEWHEDYGPVLWWRLPIEEAPVVAHMLDEDFVDHDVTHWTPLVEPDLEDAQNGG